MPLAINKGFTLVELLIVILISSILLLSTTATYNKFITQTQRQDAISSLISWQQRLEKCYLNCFDYHKCSQTTTLNILLSPNNLSAQKFYKISFTNLPAKLNYQIQAVKIKANDDECKYIFLNSNNNMWATTANGNINSNCL